MRNEDETVTNLQLDGHRPIEPKMAAQAVTLSQIQTFRAELKEMILTGDASVHNISKYNMKFFEANSVWLELINGECVIAYQSSIYMYISTTSNNQILQTIFLKNIDSGYIDRYNKMREKVDMIRAGIDPNMTDVEKALYFHDYLTENTVYKNASKFSYLASGPLIYGYGVCSGYAEALKTLLSLEGIENSRVHSSAMNHTWVYAKFSGNWYHIDPTWNDTGSVLTSGKTRTFLLRNDNEFTTSSIAKHYGWYVSTTQEKSTSTKYISWFVHDVVGKLLYYNGLWYYVNQKTNELHASDIDGNKLQKVVIGKGTRIVIDKIIKGVLYYTYNGNQNTIDLNAEDIDNNEINGFNWNNFENWRSGNYYYTDGLYRTDATRICLKNYLSCEAGETYRVRSSNIQYQVLIREMNKDLQFIQSNNLKDGQSFTATGNTAYLAIGLYNVINAAKDYTAYQTLFNNGYTMGIVPVVGPEEPPIDDEVVSTDLTDFSNWRSGEYYYFTGIYRADPTRICLNNYLTCSRNKVYWVSSSQKDYHVLVREMSENKTFIRSHNLSDGASFTTSNDTVYLAISLYFAGGSSAGLSYEHYKKLFESGYIVTIK